MNPLPERNNDCKKEKASSENSNNRKSKRKNPLFWRYCRYLRYFSFFSMVVAGGVGLALATTPADFSTAKSNVRPAAVSVPLLMQPSAQTADSANTREKDQKNDKSSQSIKTVTPDSTAVTAPLLRVLRDNDEARVIVSNRDMNRIFVRNDKITRVDVVRGRLVAHNDPSGSLLVSVSGYTPVTAFITTASGQHFSLKLSAKGISGVTLAIVLKTPPSHREPSGRAAGQGNTTLGEAAALVNADQSAENAWIERLRAVLQGRVPFGDHVMTRRELESQRLWSVFSVPKRFKGQRWVTQSVAAVTLGAGHQATRILTLTNRTRYPLSLNAADFWQPSVRAVALGCRVLPPKSTTLIYEVMENA